MALTGSTRREFERDIKMLIDHELAEATSLELEAANWDGKADAYSTIVCTSVSSGWGYYRQSTAPSYEAQNNALICRENARRCREKAQSHRDKAARHKRTLKTLLAVGQFDPGRS